MKDDGRTLPEIESMTDDDFAVAKVRMEELLKDVPQVTAAQFNEVFELMRANQGLRL